MQGLASYDRYLKISDSQKFVYGVSLGYGIYEIGDSSVYLEGGLGGAQIAYSVNNFELGYQYLLSNMSANKDNVKYEINNINYIYLDYKF
jgi:hypothetical protein